MLNASLHNQFEEVAVEIEIGRGTLADTRAELMSMNHTMKLYQDDGMVNMNKAFPIGPLA